MGFFGGGSVSTPKVKKIPERQGTKELSSEGLEAAEMQREKRNKKLGLAASIMTKRGDLEGTAGFGTLN